MAPGLTIKDRLRVLLPQDPENYCAGRDIVPGRGAPLQTMETEGQMLQRVMPELMGIKNVLVINDEAHHCYRAKPKEAEADIDELKGDDKDEAKKNNETARLWISGLEDVKRKLGVPVVFDLWATPCVTTSAPPAAPTSSIDNPSDRFPRF